MPRHVAIHTRTDARYRVHTESEEAGSPRRRGRILRWVSLAALLGLLFFGFQNAYPSLAGSEIFRLAEITVVGNDLLTTEAVVVQSGLAIGGNLFDADLTSAKARLTSLPIIQDALLLRQPPGRLVVSVRERRPVALISTVAGMVGLDAAAAVFPIPQAPVDLPIVTGLRGVLADSLSDAQSRQLVRLADFVATLQASAPRFLDEVSEVHLTSSDEVLVYLVGDGLELRMRLEDADVQARNFAAFVDAGGCRTDAPAYVDLRYSGQVVVGKLSRVTAG
jgi:cell division protein FtsQ